MGFGNFLDYITLSWSQWAVSRDNNAIFVAELSEFFVVPIWVHLNLLGSIKKTAISNDY